MTYFRQKYKYFFLLPSLPSYDNYTLVTITMKIAAITMMKSKVMLNSNSDDFFWTQYQSMKQFEQLKWNKAVEYTGKDKHVSATKFDLPWQVFFAFADTKAELKRRKMRIATETGTINAAQLESQIEKSTSYMFVYIYRRMYVHS